MAVCRLGSHKRKIINILHSLENIYEQIFQNKSKTSFICLPEINNKILRKVAHHPEVLRDWKTLARCLGLEEHDIVDIEFANQLSVKEASYQALMRWQTRKGKQASPSALVAGIRDSGFTHLAGKASL